MLKLKTGAALQQYTDGTGGPHLTADLFQSFAETYKRISSRLSSKRYEDIAVKSLAGNQNTVRRNVLSVGLESVSKLIELDIRHCNLLGCTLSLYQLSWSTSTLDSERIFKK